MSMMQFSQVAEDVYTPPNSQKQQWPQELVWQHLSKLASNETQRRSADFSDITSLKLFRYLSVQHFWHFMLSYMHTDLEKEKEVIALYLRKPELSL